MPIVIGLAEGKILRLGTHLSQQREKEGLATSRAPAVFSMPRLDLSPCPPAFVASFHILLAQQIGTRPHPLVP